jgi:hypothetical protein
LIYHRYRQDVPSATLFGAELNEEPGGEDPDLGTEWDLIVGYEPSTTFELRLTGGRFWPGAAFPDRLSAATAVTFQSKFRF